MSAFTSGMCVLAINLMFALVTVCFALSNVCVSFLVAVHARMNQLTKAQFLTSIKLLPVNSVVLDLSQRSL